MKHRIVLSPRAQSVPWVISFLLLLESVASGTTISGYIEDSESGERLIAANVYSPALQLGTTSNRYGFFTLTVDAPEVDLVVSYLGYQPHQEQIILDGDLHRVIALEPEALGLEGVEVIGERLQRPIESTQMSQVDVPAAVLRSVPTLFGEADALKALQLLPGVQSGVEGSNGVFVRGGSPDQNLILLDDAPIYNASHLFGFFSVFNPDAVRHVSLIKGGFPARYGGRLSSVIDVALNDGNSQEFTGNGGVGLISSRLTFEGPISKDRTSFLVSGRRTYIDVLARPFMPEDEGAAGYYFYDVTAKVNHRISSNDRVYLSTYTGQDRFYYSDESSYEYGENRHEGSDDADVSWGNLTSTLRWNHLLSPTAFANTTLLYSEYGFDLGADSRSVDVSPEETVTELTSRQYHSGIRDLSARLDLEYQPSPALHFRAGAGATLHEFSPGASEFTERATNEEPVITALAPSDQVDATEARGYVEAEFELGPRLRFDLGVHGSLFAENERTYRSVEPRFSGRYLWSSEWALKASYATTSQYIHLLTNTSVGLPTDLWVPTTDRVKPQEAWQTAFGVTHTPDDDAYELTIEGYYKAMENLLSYSEGASYLSLDTDWQDLVTVGDGVSYGAEVLLRRSEGRTTGWLAYTLAWSERTYPELNGGEPFPFKYDRRHDVSLALQHRTGRSLEWCLNWVYGTGLALTLPVARYQRPSDPEGYDHVHEIIDYGDRNSYRAGAYHRLDLSLNLYASLPGTRGHFTFAVYNAYNRKNPFYIYFDQEYGDQGSTKTAKQVSLFPILPSISYSFRF